MQGKTNKMKREINVRQKYRICKMILNESYRDKIIEDESFDSGDDHWWVVSKMNRLLDRIIDDSEKFDICYNCDGEGWVNSKDLWSSEIADSEELFKGVKDGQEFVAMKCKTCKGKGIFIFAWIDGDKK